MQVDAPERTSFTFDTVPEALEAFENGEFLVVMDDENRENEGDLIIAGSQCTTEKMAWMIKHTRSVPLQFSLSFFFNFLPRRRVDSVGTSVARSLGRGLRNSRFP